MRKLLLSISLILPLATFAQAKRLGEDVAYKASITGIISNGENAPFWFTNNKYGLGHKRNNYGYIRAEITRSVKADSAQAWKFGYGADIVAAMGIGKSVVLQQVYGDIQWKKLMLSIGQKERALELKNQHLSSGGMTTGINARPTPQIRLELPDFITIPRTNKWLAIKGHLAYGWYTDNKWQRDFNNGNKNYPYTNNSKYHSKAGYIRIGNKERIPLTITGGLEMSCQFGGQIWNAMDRVDHNDPNFATHQKLESGIKSYLHALIPGGSDINDGDYSNKMGNHVGSWHIRAEWENKGWLAAAYLEHYFEDHSQLFWQYGWKDNLLGIELRFPKNKFISNAVYEHIGTKDQSGPVYHDKTENLPLQISGCDEYYCHQVYGAWQHSGFTMGSPLLLSPLYNTTNRIFVYHNRIVANHIGLSGKPHMEWNWRILYTHEKSWGAYKIPVLEPLTASFYFAEVEYVPKKISGLSIGACFGRNDGTLIGTSNGGMLTISYSGILK